jgi:hypothetical protein
MADGSIVQLDEIRKNRQRSQFTVVLSTYVTGKSSTACVNVLSEPAAVQAIVNRLSTERCTVGAIERTDPCTLTISAISNRHFYWKPIGPWTVFFNVNSDQKDILIETIFCRPPSNSPTPLTTPPKPQRTKGHSSGQRPGVKKPFIRIGLVASILIAVWTFGVNSELYIKWPNDGLQRQATSFDERFYGTPSGRETSLSAYLPLYGLIEHNETSSHTENRLHAIVKPANVKLTTDARMTAAEVQHAYEKLLKSRRHVAVEFTNSHSTPSTGGMTAAEVQQAYVKLLEITRLRKIRNETERRAVHLSSAGTHISGGQTAGITRGCIDGPCSMSPRTYRANNTRDIWQTSPPSIRTSAHWQDRSILTFQDANLRNRSWADGLR